MEAGEARKKGQNQDPSLEIVTIEFMRWGENTGRDM